MLNIASKFRSFFSSDSGATLVEYGIVIVLAVTVGTSGLITLAGQISSNMDQAAIEMAASP
jgi:Flp pilus assembly pilin Flp